MRPLSACPLPVARRVWAAEKGTSMHFECSDPNGRLLLLSADLGASAQVLHEWCEAAARDHRAPFEAIGPTGSLITPEGYFVAAALRDRFELWGANEWSAWHSGPGVVAFMEADQVCDGCHEDQARYDCVLRPSDCWAYLCGHCYRVNSSRILGTGKGQFLIYPGTDSGIYVEMFEHIHRLMFGPDQV